MTKKRDPWTPEEDTLLTDVVGRLDAKRWDKIAELVPGRTAKQCRERWKNHLDTNICKDKWSKKEDKKIIALLGKCGKKWSLIAKSLPGRSDVACKNRYHGSLKRRYCIDIADDTEVKEIDSTSSSSTDDEQYDRRAPEPPKAKRTPQKTNYTPKASNSPPDTPTPEPFVPKHSVELPKFAQASSAVPISLLVSDHSADNVFSRSFPRTSLPSVPTHTHFVKREMDERLNDRGQFIQPSASFDKYRQTSNSMMRGQFEAEKVTLPPITDLLSVLF
eukprot:c7434_g1_i1.p1 GENE.c7434_g1_i1~~c7434_g1_i1.p1  ORF type:complete len:275 (-),score=25.32 c7434_g1_i1:43-867(-)